MAEKTEGSITIDADPASIMAVIADYKAYPEWSDGIKEVEIVEPGSSGRAKQVRFAVSAGPIEARYILAYEYLLEDRGVSWTYVEGSGGIKDLEGEYLLRPGDEGTEVTYRLAMDVSIPGPGFLKRKLMAEGEKRIIGTALKGLKERVESIS